MLCRAISLSKQIEQLPEKAMYDDSMEESFQNGENVTSQDSNSTIT